MEPVTFLLTPTDGIENWESSFSVVAHAPDIVFSELFIDDSEGGNGDSLLAPGESADLIITLGNAGSYLGENIEAILTCEGKKIAVRFKDGELICAYTLSFTPDRDGFFVSPADTAGNNIQIYVLTAAAVEIKAGPAAEALAQRALGVKA